MNVSIDRDGCIACAICVDLCPEVFQLADDGLAEVIADPSAGGEGTVQEAADNCPVSVIHVKD